MRTLFFVVITLMVTSCSYRITNNYNYNCCPQQASWIDTIGTLGNHTVHVIGTRKDVDYIFSKTNFFSIKGFTIVEVVGTSYTVEIRNPHF